MLIAAVARQLGIGWDSVNGLALQAIGRLVYDTPGHLDQVRYLGVDEHKWKHCCGQGDPFVSIIVDLTPVITGTGPARLLDMVPGRSAAAMSDWLDARDQSFRDQVEIVSLDGFAGYHRAAAQSLPAATRVMDPLHVVHLAAQKLTVSALVLPTVRLPTRLLVVLGGGRRVGLMMSSSRSWRGWRRSRRS